MLHRLVVNRTRIKLIAAIYFIDARPFSFNVKDTGIVRHHKNITVFNARAYAQLVYRLLQVKPYEVTPAHQSEE